MFNKLPSGCAFGSPRGPRDTNALKSAPKLHIPRKRWFHAQCLPFPTQLRSDNCNLPWGYIGQTYTQPPRTLTTFQWEFQAKRDSESATKQLGICDSGNSSFMQDSKHGGTFIARVFFAAFFFQMNKPKWERQMWEYRCVPARSQLFCPFVFVFWHSAFFSYVLRSGLQFESWGLHTSNIALFCVCVCVCSRYLLCDARL